MIVKRILVDDLISQCVCVHGIELLKNFKKISPIVKDLIHRHQMFSWDRGPELQILMPEDRHRAKNP